MKKRKWFSKKKKKEHEEIELPQNVFSNSSDRHCPLCGSYHQSRNNYLAYSDKLDADWGR